MLSQSCNLFVTKDLSKSLALAIEGISATKAPSTRVNYDNSVCAHVVDIRLDLSIDILPTSQSAVLDSWQVMRCHSALWDPGGNSLPMIVAVTCGLCKDSVCSAEPAS